ncbi:UV excision repair protein RAD23 homolog A [Drosophila pseudoobscura]|uniref:UV excision repair protein RAD23 n=1 Tax=Drosophila pseudoobscura pseudoobscura TaxID=46245 RepID=Q29CY5_DROPS|nr:UV excision repair protein RAD23 homolog A [Drosophila pseudoobscura]
MIITVKNLQQQTFTIEFDPEKTVLELKKKIFDERGVEYVAEKQKLIYAGVILMDDRTIASYKIDEKKFIVVMLTRDTAASTAASSTSDTQPKRTNEAEGKLFEKEKNIEKTISSTSGSTPISGAVESAPSVSVSSTGTAIQRPYSSSDLVGELANASLQTRAESNLLMGEEYNKTVLSMVEMGYPRDQVERAMGASFNNPERAVEYLINGIPTEDESLFNAGDETNNQNPRAPGSQPISEPAVDLPAQSSDPFEFLRSQPQFLQMRSLIYQNPHLLHAVLQQIGQTNPALLQLISENQDAFLNMLNQPIEGESASGNNTQRSTPPRIQSFPTRTESLPSSATEEGPVANQRSSAGGIAADQLQRPDVADREVTEQSAGIATIRLNAQDQDAIERLKALGFPEALVLQAYFACEKDEELAANFLLSSSFDD